MVVSVVVEQCQCVLCNSGDDSVELCNYGDCNYGDYGC